LFRGFQFDTGGQPVPVIADVLTALADRQDAWSLALWSPATIHASAGCALSTHRAATPDAVVAAAWAPGRRPDLNPALLSSGHCEPPPTPARLFPSEANPLIGVRPAGKDIDRVNDAQHSPADSGRDSPGRAKGHPPASFSSNLDSDSG